MRPIKLKIKGINSYVSEQVIDFRKLSENNLFGIFGDTGSGKTTILDAITIALYGTSDRESLQNIINVNLKNAFIEYEFDMVEPKSTISYYVRRDFKLRPSGLKTDAVFIDKTNNITLADMSDTVNDEILRVVGIGKKEFSKCIALPQGEFDRFLLDTPVNRKKTISKLFDLECFGSELNEKIKHRKEGLTYKKLSLEDKLSEFEDITPEIIKQNVQKLDDLKQEKVELKKQLDINSKELELKKFQLAEKNKLFDLELNFTLKQSETKEIDELKERVDFTRKYGDFIELSNKNKILNKEIIDLNEKLIVAKHELNKSEISIEKWATENETIKLQMTQVKAVLDELNIQSERKKLLEIKVSELVSDKEEVAERIKNVSNRKVDLEKNLNNYKYVLKELADNRDKIVVTFNQNLATIEKLKNSRELKTKQDFVLFLNVLKNDVSAEALEEVSEFSIYDEINYMLRKIENYELSVRKEIGEIFKDINDLSAVNSNLKLFQTQLEDKNADLEKSKIAIEEKIDNSKRLNYITEAQVNNMNKQLAEYSKSIDKLNSEIANTREEVERIELNKYRDVYAQNLMLSEKLKNNQENADKAIANRHQIIVEIEVNTNKLANAKDRLLDVKKALKNFKSEVNDNIEPLDANGLVRAEKRIKTFEEDYTYMWRSIDILRKSTSGYNVTKEEVDKLTSFKDLANARLVEIEGFISVNEYTIEIQRENLKSIEVLDNQLKDTIHKIDVINRLQNLVSGQALIEYVSEEYMLLVTEFANDYVYSISKGKYMLTYDGEFKVIDNFNGGIKRSVRTLSGGERFIVSLSLALGISQSISVNNNKHFNFFFIDEGFGSLSDGYIEKVLQSFNQLINLDFTIGFITHVEKMQYYLNNRIVVTKENNEMGSIVKQYS